MTFLSETRPVHVRRSTRLSGLFDLAALRRQRRALARMDDTRLNDIGLTRVEAETEARRPFWDFP